MWVCSSSSHLVASWLFGAALTTAAQVGVHAASFAESVDHSIFTWNLRCTSLNTMELRSDKWDPKAESLQSEAQKGLSCDRFVGEVCMLRNRSSSIQICDVLHLLRSCILR